MKIGNVFVSEKGIKYNVGNDIVEGGTSFIYKLELDNNYYALKLLKRKLPSEKNKRFINEINFCQKTNHKNIITILEFGEIEIKEKKYQYYIMPFYSKTLKDLIYEGIEHSIVPEYIEQIVTGLSIAHNRDVIHRDIKPENILYDFENNNLIIADWGIAYFKDEEQKTIVETKPTTRLANFQYASPEQRIKGGIITKQSDIYALGLIINEMFTKEIPIGSNYKKINEINSNYAYYDAIVEWATRQNPDERPKSIERLSKKTGVYYFERSELDLLLGNIVLNIELYETDIPNYSNTIEVLKYWIYNSKIPSKKNKYEILVNEVVAFISELAFKHPFYDGNKRISNITLTSTLDYLDLKLIAKRSEIEQMINNLVLNKINIVDFENWLKPKIISKSQLKDLDILLKIIKKKTNIFFDFIDFSVGKIK